MQSTTSNNSTAALASATAASSQPAKTVSNETLSKQFTTKTHSIRIAINILGVTEKKNNEKRVNSYTDIERE